MKTLVVYDSKHGNTEKIAKMIGEATGGQVCHVGTVNPADLTGCDLLIVGSPTHGGFPTENIVDMLKAALGPQGLRVAAFDTRTKTTVFGYAAPKIARRLEKNGGQLQVTPEGFLYAASKAHSWRANSNEPPGGHQRWCIDGRRRIIT
jgi:flavodoxin